MAITYLTEKVKLQKQFKKRKTSQWIKEIVKTCDRKIGEIVFVFCSDEKIIEINNQYLQHDYYTDVITFDYSKANTISGDLFISLETVQTNAELYKTDFNEELHRVIIHGILHLCGYKDRTRAQKKRTHERENEALRRFHAIME